MTREEFIKVLDKERYSYKIEGNKVIVTRGGDVYLNALTSLPPGVEFRNEGYVWLKSLTSLPPGVEFNNRGYVYLESLTGDWFSYWGNIRDIDSNRLLNKMISLGLFDKNKR
jgi:hypothetical protein